jgi:flagellar biosynthetic protein FlhB
MADDQEKTEEPTSKKIDDAKKEGNIPKSTEVPGAAILFFTSIYLLFFANPLWEELGKMMLYIYSFIGKEIDSTVLYTINYHVITSLLYVLVPFFIIVIVFAIAFNTMQFGFLVVPIKIKLEKINPISGFKNIFSMKKAIEALKLSAKLIIIFIVMIVILIIVWNDILAMMDMGINAALHLIVQLTIYFVATILLIVIIFAIIDFFFTRHYYFKQLKMSKQEIKDEHKQLEGDPLVKGRIRQIQMKMSRQSMLNDVSEADVVITNPTHYAVALKYQKEKSNAPLLTAKGIDFLALKIKDVARENKVPIIENPSMARALYDQLEIDDEIPKEFYEAVAEIFTYVYELNKKG